MSIGSTHSSAYVGEEKEHGERFRLYTVVDHSLIREEELLFLVVVFDPHGFVKCPVLFSAYGDVVHSSEADERLEVE